MSYSDAEATDEENNNTQPKISSQETPEFSNDETPPGNLLYLRVMLCIF